MFTLYSFYRSREWEALRKRLMLERVDDNGDIICAECYKPITNKYDCIAHHKIELTEANVNNYDISLNANNIELLHHKCHNKRHDRFGSYTKHIYIVYGSPCSGKSTYVKENAHRHDLIVDIDELYKAVSNNPLHDKSNRLTGNVLQLRDMLIDMIATRNGKWINAWVITSKCIPNELERLSNKLNAEILHVDTDKDTCLARAEQRVFGDYKKYVNEYFENYYKFENLLEKLE